MSNTDLTFTQYQRILGQMTKEEWDAIYQRAKQEGTTMWRLLIERPDLIPSRLRRFAS